MNINIGDKRYIISDAAKMIDVESHVLRYWEEELEVEVPRNEMGHRYYTDYYIELFKRIKELKDSGFQLKAIKMLLPDLMNMDENGRVNSDVGILKEELFGRLLAIDGGEAAQERREAEASASAQKAGQSGRQQSGENGVKEIGTKAAEQAGRQQGCEAGVKEDGRDIEKQTDKQQVIEDLVKEAGSASAERTSQQQPDKTSEKEAGLASAERTSLQQPGETSEKEAGLASAERTSQQQPDENGVKKTGADTAKRTTQEEIAQEMISQKNSETSGETQRQKSVSGADGTEPSGRHQEEAGQAQSFTESTQLGKAQNSNVSQNVVDNSKLHQFQMIITEVVSNALKENTSALGQEVGEIVSDNVIKEMDYLMTLREKQEEERFKKLDETIRSYQNSNREKTKSGKGLLSKFKR